MDTDKQGWKADGRTEGEILMRHAAAFIILWRAEGGRRSAGAGGARAVPTRDTADKCLQAKALQLNPTKSKRKVGGSIQPTGHEPQFRNSNSNEIKRNQTKSNQFK